MMKLTQRVLGGMAGVVYGGFVGVVAGGIATLGWRVAHGPSLESVLEFAGRLPYTDFFVGNLHEEHNSDLSYIFSGIKISMAVVATYMSAKGFITGDIVAREDKYPSREHIRCQDCSQKDNCRSYSDFGYHAEPCTLRYERPDEAI